MTQIRRSLLNRSSALVVGLIESRLALKRAQDEVNIARVMNDAVRQGEFKPKVRRG